MNKYFTERVKNYSNTCSFFKAKKDNFTLLLLVNAGILTT